MAEATTTRVCADCGECFELTTGQIDWYVTKFGPDGLRPGCRADRRMQRDRGEFWKPEDA